MNVPYESIIYLNDFTPTPIYPAVALILGIIHLFPPCCIASFVLGEIGQNIQNWLAVHSYSTSNWPLFFQAWESDYYDENRKMHICRFHAKQAEIIQMIPFEERSWYQRWLGRSKD